MKKVNYEFVTGEVVDVEVSEYWEEVLKEMDRLEHNSNQTETRRHCTLDVLGDEGEWLVDKTSNPEESICEAEAFAERIDAALPYLSESQKEVLISVCFKGISVAKYAAEKGIGLSTAYFNLDRAKNNFKKFF